MKISSIEGNRQKLDGGAMFGNAPRPLWERWHTPDSQNRIELACRALLLEFGSYKVLCETGIGAFFEPKLAERYGVQTPQVHCLLENLQKLGLGENDITHVILSHLHFDHVGGLLPVYGSGEDRLLFPKAQYLVGTEALARAENPHPRDQASFIPGLTEKLRASGRMKVVEKDKSPDWFGGKISFLYSWGHTPGHMHTLARGEQKSVLFCGDLVPGRSWLHVPISMGYDRFPEQVIDEKAAMYEKAIRERWLLFYTHDPDAAMSECQKDEKGKIVPVNSQEKLLRYAI